MRAAAQTEIVKREAARLGFDACGVAAAVPLTEDARRLENWLSKGYQSGMHWIEKHFDLRIDPRKLVPGAKSVITLLLNYFPGEVQAADAPRIAKYAWGADYHDVIRGRLNAFLDVLQEQIGAVEGRGFVDSAPVLERAWAVRSGLGWVGKNANLLTRQGGSFFFIATLITDLELLPDSPFAADLCGTCTRCVEACPTDAIVSPTVIDSNRCISYLTIELKEAMIPDSLAGKTEGWVFGCDICQDVCPWNNRFARPHDDPAFKPLPAVLGLSRRDWEEMTEDMFRTALKGSPIRRAKWKGMMRNLRAGNVLPD